MLFYCPGSGDVIYHTEPEKKQPAFTELKPAETVEIHQAPPAPPLQASYNGARPKQRPSRDVMEMQPIRECDEGQSRKRQPYLIKSATNGAATDTKDPTKVYVATTGWRSLSDVMKVQN